MAQVSKSSNTTKPAAAKPELKTVTTTPVSATPAAKPAASTAPATNKPASATKPAAKKAATVKSAAKKSTKKATVVKKAKPAQVKPATTDTVKSMAAKPLITSNQMVETGAESFRQAQDQMLSFGQESADQLAKSADAAGKAMSDALDFSKENMEAAVECGAVLSDAAREMGDEVMASINEVLSENLEIAKDTLACRTVNDFIELQNRFVRTNVDRALEQTAKISETMFRLTAEAVEPMNERIGGATEKLTKNWKV